MFKNVEARVEVLGVKSPPPKLVLTCFILLGEGFGLDQGLFQHGGRELGSVGGGPCFTARHLFFIEKVDRFFELNVGTVPKIGRRDFVDANGQEFGQSLLPQVGVPVVFEFDVAEAVEPTRRSNGDEVRSVLCFVLDRLMVQRPNPPRLPMCPSSVVVDGHSEAGVVVAFDDGGEDFKGRRFDGKRELTRGRNDRPSKVVRWTVPTQTETVFGELDFVRCGGR